AIKFKGWRAGGGHFYHPLQRYEMGDGFNVAQWGLKLKRGAEPFDYSCFTIPALRGSQRSPRYLDRPVFADQVQDHFGDEPLQRKNVLADHKVQYPYAYHFDAHLLAEYLKGYAMQRGVGQILDDVVSVNLSEDGSIASIQTKEHGAVAGD